ncbi:MAG: type secretion protein [Acidimicrobiaceae bacterium]|nr:type secretion protein [Acidimicrobiaceae bacterium]
MFAVAGAVLMLWSGAVLAAVIHGSAAPGHDVAGSIVRLLRHPGDPSWAWRSDLPGPVLYWTCTLFVVVAVTVACLPATRIIRSQNAARIERPVTRLPGTAQTRDVREVSSKALLARAATLRPSLEKPRPGDVGYRLGSARRSAVWMSIEDSAVVLGPPRSGKGLHLVVPFILDSPGSVLTTSTRPDNLAATLNHRSKRGPAAVFDPQGLARGVSSVLRWSPIRGCETPQTAMVRARALSAGNSKGVENADFWQAQTESVIRSLLHAAALDGRSPRDLYRWSLSPSAAGEAVRALSSPSAASGWSESLDEAISADPRTRDSIWVGVRTALSSLADPRVLDAVSPSQNEALDPEAVLRDGGTLYLLGTSAGAGAAGNLIGAFIEDVVEVARRVAARSANARLDPPLALILDEVANYPLPSLPSLMSEGGGSGITTVAVLQSLAQARAVWGDHRGTSIWDASSVKIVLGGGSNARDLADLSALIGERDDETSSESRDGRGSKSTTKSLRRLPILDQSRLRTLPFGHAVALVRSSKPIVLEMQSWRHRRDARVLERGKQAIEHAMVEFDG